MCAFGRGIKHPLDVPIDGFQNPDARAHHEVAAFGGNPLAIPSAWVGIASALGSAFTVYEWE
jgi:hypothetical protein